MVIIIILQFYFLKSMAGYHWAFNWNRRHGDVSEPGSRQNAELTQGMREDGKLRTEPKVGTRRGGGLSVQASARKPKTANRLEITHAGRHSKHFLRI